MREKERGDDELILYLLSLNKFHEHATVELFIDYYALVLMGK